jgi:hypothetical protein
MLSVYGQRANMVSFSCLVAVSLAFASISTGWSMIIHSSLILSGGLFYLLISIIFQYLSPHRYVELQIADCIKLTAKYLKLRGDLWTVTADRKAIIEKHHLQVELNTIHQSIREVLVRTRYFRIFQSKPKNATCIYLIGRNFRIGFIYSI